MGLALLINKLRPIYKQLLFVWLAGFLIVTVSYLLGIDMVHDQLAKEAKNALFYTQSKITTDLREGETTLHNVSQSIRSMILRGNSAEAVLEYMTDITKYLSSSDARVFGFNGIYGIFDVFKNKYLDGTSWIPPEDYVPQERPWYKAVSTTGDDIATSIVYVDAQTNEIIISYSRRIFNIKGEPLGVVCVDVLLDRIVKYVTDTRLAEGGYGILLNDYLEIIAVPTKEYIGKKLVELPYKGIPSVVNNLKSGIDIYEYKIIDDQLGLEYILFTKQLGNGWHVGILTPENKYYQKVKNIRIFITALGVFLLSIISFILFRLQNYNDNLAIANGKLKVLSVTDELTELCNRRSFLEHIDIIWKQNHRLNLPITVLMIDIDCFKKYNDSLGHLEGDKALIAVAQCLKKNVKRETDFIARFGGEEFVCLLPFIKDDEALEFSKTLVQNIEDMKISHPTSLHSKYVTISVGMASTVPSDNNSYTQLLDEADKALYSAKESGRNRVVMFTP
jgi:diguanylate cyclase (GGDEF)-like protein